jgi:hypothetical protein
MIQQRSNVATKAGVAQRRRTVGGDHASVVGQGILVSALDERVRRIGRHLGMPGLVAR